jgi:hypothetical protein
MKTSHFLRLIEVSPFSFGKSLQIIKSAKIVPESQGVKVVKVVVGVTF